MSWDFEFENDATFNGFDVTDGFFDRNEVDNEIAGYVQDAKNMYHAGDADYVQVLNMNDLAFSEADHDKQVIAGVVEEMTTLPMDRFKAIVQHDKQTWYMAVRFGAIAQNDKFWGKLYDSQPDWLDE